MKPPYVPLDLGYLKALATSGAKPVDLWAVAFNQNVSHVTVELEDGTRREYLIRAENALFMPHYKEAIAFCGFGPKGLSNFIYADALEFARSHGLKNKGVEVQLSKECADRVGKHIERYLSYGFTFRVAPSMKNLSWSFAQTNGPT